MTFRCSVCSAGCGRTGALCVIDYTWNLLKKEVIYCSACTFFSHCLSKIITSQRYSGYVCLCFLDDHSGFQHLQLSSTHENPEALTGSNQGSYSFFTGLFTTKAEQVIHPPTSRPAFLTIFNVCIKALPMILSLYVTALSCVTWPRSFIGFFLTTGTVWVGLQHHQVAVWEISAVYGPRGPQRWGERLATLVSERLHTVGLMEM